MDVYVGLEVISLRPFNLVSTGHLHIQVVTSVNGSGARWAQLLQRLFEGRAWPAVNIDIHDFGATPGVVRLRLEQGFEEIAHD